MKHDGVRGLSRRPWNTLGWPVQTEAAVTCRSSDVPQAPAVVASSPAVAVIGVGRRIAGGRVALPKAMISQTPGPEEPNVAIPELPARRSSKSERLGLSAEFGSSMINSASKNVPLP